MVIKWYAPPSVPAKGLLKTLWLATGPVMQPGDGIRHGRQLAQRPIAA